MNNSKEINPKDFLTTLQRDSNSQDGFYVPIRFDSYQDLGLTIENISNVCINYLYAKEHSGLMEENLFDVIKLLEIQKQLIPHSEFEYLNRVNEQL